MPAVTSCKENRFSYCLSTAVTPSRKEEVPQAKLSICERVLEAASQESLFFFERPLDARSASQPQEKRPARGQGFSNHASERQTSCRSCDIKLTVPRTASTATVGTESPQARGSARLRFWFRCSWQRARRSPAPGL